MKFLIFLILIVATAYSDICNCGNSHAFNSYKFKCIEYPKKQKDKGFVEGCDDYFLTGLTSDKWNCQGCSPSYRFNINNRTCTATQLEGCTDFSLKSNQNGTVQPDQLQLEVQQQQRFLAQDSNNTSQGSKYQCDECEQKEYYLRDHKCVKNPKKGDDYIKKCLIYEFKSNKVQCQFCSEGYYVDKDKKCTKNPGDKGCLYFAYNQVTQKPQCTKCEEKGYYMNNINNTCLKNPKEPKGCKSFEYKSQNQAKCTDCEKDYFLGKDDKCVKSEDVIKNCKFAVYDQGKYICNECEKGYYFPEGREKCETNPKKGDSLYVQDCQLYGYSPQIKKVICGQCKDNQALDKDLKKCNKLTLESIDKVDKCFTYFTNNQNKQYCAACEAGLIQTSFQNEIKACRKCPKNPDSSEILQISLVLVTLLLFSII